MRELGKKGGKARTRPGMGGKQLSASLRERLRESIDGDRLAEVLVAGLESENAKERLDVAKLVLAELATGPKTQGWVCTCYSAPGQYCQQLEPHGYRSSGGKPLGSAISRSRRRVRDAFYVWVAQRRCRARDARADRDGSNLPALVPPGREGRYTKPDG